MSSRSSSLRIKVVALLLSLFSLWVFAATVTAREGLNLLWLGVLKDDLAIPADELVTSLQHERRLSLAYVGGGTEEQRNALADRRRRTDAAVRKFQRLAQGPSVERAAGPALEERIDEMSEALTTLATIRSTIDARRVERGDAAALFAGSIDAGFGIYTSISTLDDEGVAKHAPTMVQMSRSRELLSQEDAMLAGVLAGGQRFTAPEHARFVQLVGAQRFLYAEAFGEMPRADQERYATWAAGSAFQAFRAAEEQAVRSEPGTRIAADAAGWTTIAETTLTERRALETASANDLGKRATPVVVWVIVRLALAGALGLIAVIASIVVSITTARALVRQLEKLRNAASDLANERLPRVVDRLRRGEAVDVDAEAPPLQFGTDEVGQVGRAFNDVQATAIRAAVEQAELRQGVRDVFLSLARRSQTLVHRQLTLLDTMERRTSEPEELEHLFRIDHLATRMRRNAENLIVLSGAVPGRGWRNPVPMVDVIRGAVAEVEEYERVTVAPIGSAALAGRAVGDVIHLLAELIENALTFSPPHTTVHVSGELVGTGFTVEIEDRGLGMTPADLEDANERLADPPEFNLSSNARLGLYVVGRLSERHRLKVQLRSSAYGGVTAVVLIPSGLVVSDDATAIAASIVAGRRDRGVARERNPQRDRVREAPAHRTLTSVAGERTATVEAPPAEKPAPGDDDAPTDDRPSIGADTVTIDVDAVTATAPTVEPATVEPATVEPATPEAPPAAAPPRCGATRPNEPAPSASSGLPRRVRQASLAAPLLEGPSPAGADSTSAPETRPPEEIRQMMASYQRGTAQGRVEADDNDITGDEPSPAQDGTPTEAGIGQNSGDR
jgi:signal transduction histidine kinase